MTSKIRTIFFIMVLCISMESIKAAAYTEVEDQQAQFAAEKAVALLGKGRGAIVINSKSVDIVGFVSNISSKSTDIKKTLKDLNAKIVGMDVLISLSGDVLFDFDKWNVKPEAEKVLTKVAKAIVELKKKSIVIEGHTDSKGSNSYNLNLSQRRAESVRDWFLEKGNLGQIRFMTRGYGESRPIAPNTNYDGSDNPEGRMKNRRVEIIIKGSR